MDSAFTSFPALCRVLLAGLFSFLAGGSLHAQPSESGSTALPAISSAVSDASGRIVVNGKPFFPILLYDVPSDPEVYQKIHEHGFNLVTAGRSEDADKARQAGLYVAGHGKKFPQLDSVLLGIGMDSPVLNLKEPLLDNLKANLDKVREDFPGRLIMHAIGYWLNEPSGVVANSLPPKEKYESVVQTIDVAAPYLYPVPYQPIRSVGEAVQRAHEATQGQKPLLPILQLFKWTAQDRYPTPAELRCMVYLSLIHGAKGIGYYSYGYVTGKKGTNIATEQPESWNSVKSLNAEITRMAPFILRTEGSFPEENEAENGIHILRLANGGRRMVLLANPSKAVVETELKISAANVAQLEAIDGTESGVVRDGVAKIKFEPLGVRAFEY